MMRSRVVTTAVGLTVAGGLAIAQPKPRLNPLIDLLTQNKPVFGLYAPANRGVRPGAPAAATATPPAVPPVVKTPADLAKEALAYEQGDILFSGSMEGNFERGYGPFAEFVAELAKSPARLKHPLVTKIPKIGADPDKAIDNISKQLNLGVSTVVFVDVESAGEVKQGLAAMRLKASGGTRPDEVGSAPAYWGLSDQEYRQKADLWPLNPNGELVNWTIVESKAGLAKVREIAAVKGIGALFPGAGTLRGVFTTVNQEGQRIFDQEGWEGAIQQVLSACKEFNVPCGYPATEADIEMRMKQGFSVFIINWGDAGFRAVDIGRKASGR
jgi:2-keto-3-deoxy-L-rhamnonate aldolase RhmA